MREAGFTGSICLDPFDVLVFLLLRLGKTVNQPWLFGLMLFRRCIQRRELPTDLCVQFLRKLFGGVVTSNCTWKGLHCFRLLVRILLLYWIS